MTAPANPISPSFMPAPHGKLVPLTVDQYHAMIDNGILEEGAPIELLDGMLVRKDRSAKGEDPMTIGGKHRKCVQLLLEAINPKLPKTSVLQTQQPISLPPIHEPEPDLSIVTKEASRRDDGHPTPPDIFSVIEVSDSSLEFDRSTKQRIYAAAGIPQYVIVNLVAGQIEVYEDPRATDGRYAEMKTISKGQTLKLKAGSGIEIELNSGEFLP